MNTRMISVDVLRALRVRIGDDERSVGGRRERVLLALLSTTPGRHVGDDRIIDELWGDDPPVGATSAVQVAVSRLRRALGDDAEVRRDAAGYALVGAEVNARPPHARRRRVGVLDPAAALETTDAALGLWRGAPYVGLGAAPTLALEATRLEEVRLVLVEARAGAAGPRPTRGRPTRALSPWWAPTPFGSACGRSWRSPSTAATARPTPSRRCGCCGRPSSTSSASTRRRRSRELERRIVARTLASTGRVSTRLDHRAWA